VRGKSLVKRIGCWTLLGAPWLWPAAAGAAPPAVSANAVRETQLLLYVSRPFGSSAPRTWGLRLDQATAPPVDTASIRLGPLHRRELVNLMITPHVRTELQIGGRLTWDLRDNRFSVRHR